MSVNVFYYITMTEDYFPGILFSLHLTLPEHVGQTQMGAMSGLLRHAQRETAEKRQVV
jgi:hypothetical protein